MIDEEKTLWDLFCMTGEPQYYSMYVRKKSAQKDEKPEK